MVAIFFPRRLAMAAQVALNSGERFSPARPRQAGDIRRGGRSPLRGAGGHDRAGLWRILDNQAHSYERLLSGNTARFHVRLAGDPAPGRRSLPVTDVRAPQRQSSRQGPGGRCVTCELGLLHIWYTRFAPRLHAGGVCWRHRGRASGRQGRAVRRGAGGVRVLRQARSPPSGQVGGAGDT
jgi:hypothetical protein